jgi:D-3-phosphoglycerate dehydrogenase / 2-oxoglutarate reductase
MIKKTNLFSAPFSFIPDIKDEYENVIPTIFKEIWNKEQLTQNHEIISWVVNPGQNFIINKEIINLFPNLEVLITPSTGTNHINIKDCEEYGIKVYSLLNDRNGLQTITASAEFTFMLILNTLKRLDIGKVEVSARRWRKHEDILRGNELNGKKVGIVGLGRIGNHIANWCKVFNAKVLYYDPYVSNKIKRTDSLEFLFSDSDIICICCILNDETTCMIDLNLLKLMKANACLINSSRGEVIKEKDLVKVLRNRKDIRVGIDVLAGEINGTHLDSQLLEFHDQGRIVITPHIAGATVESQLKAAIIALRLLKLEL